jgi:hypothetical protein
MPLILHFLYCSKMSYICLPFCLIRLWRAKWCYGDLIPHVSGPVMFSDLPTKKLTTDSLGCPPVVLIVSWYQVFEKSSYVLTVEREKTRTVCWGLEQLTKPKLQHSNCACYMGPMFQLFVVVCVVITRLTFMKIRWKMFKGIQFRSAAKMMNAIIEETKQKVECVYKRVCMLWKNMLLKDIW